MIEHIVNQIEATGRAMDETVLEVRRGAGWSAAPGIRLPMSAIRRNLPPRL